VCELGSHRKLRILWENLMTRNLVKGTAAFALLLGASMMVTTPAQAGGFLSKLFGKKSSCCAPAPVCCQPAPVTCCEPAPVTQPCCGSEMAAPMMGDMQSSQGYDLAPGETLVPGSVNIAAEEAAPAAEAAAPAAEEAAPATEEAAEAPAAEEAAPATEEAAAEEAPAAGDAVPSSSDEAAVDAAEEAAPPVPQPDAATDI